MGHPTRLHNGTLSRRRWLQLMAAGVSTAAVVPSGLLAVDPAFKPLWLNQYTYTAPDMRKTADWYMEVFGMQKGASTSKETHLWFGDTQGDTLMIVRQAQPGDVAPGLSRFGFTINYWDRQDIESELRTRGIRAQSDTDKGFWFKDPDGNEIGVFAKDWMRRPSGAAPRAPVWKALSANHIVVLTEDYRRLVNWYADLLAFNQTTDSGRDVCMWFGDSVWLPTQTRAGQKTSAALGTLDHCALTVADYDTPKVVAELKRLKIIPADSTLGADGQPDYGIYGVDPNGFKLQVCSWLEAVTQDRRRMQRISRPQ